jgi:hypothetical protein
VRDVEILTNEARLSVLSDRNVIPPAGVCGGASGAPNRYSVYRQEVEVKVSDFPGKIANFALFEGDLVRMESSGGGGWGRPSDRNPEAINRDIENGYVTESGLLAYRNSDVHASLAGALDLDGHLCRVSEEIATALDLAPGDLLELTSVSGPSIRLWVDEVAYKSGSSIDVPTRFAEIKLAGICKLSSYSRPAREKVGAV